MSVISFSVQLKKHDKDIKHNQFYIYRNKVISNKDKKVCLRLFSQYIIHLHELCTCIENMPFESLKQ